MAQRIYLNPEVYNLKYICPHCKTRLITVVDSESDADYVTIYCKNGLCMEISEVHKDDTTVYVNPIRENRTLIEKLALSIESIDGGNQ